MKPTDVILASTACAGIYSSCLAQDPGPPPIRQGVHVAAFGEPEQLFAGGQPMGITRHYPSPVLFDVDQDGVRELVIGDLHGYVTACEPVADGWAEEVRILATDGKPLKFHNW